MNRRGRDRLDRDVASGIDAAAVEIGLDQNRVDVAVLLLADEVARRRRTDGSGHRVVATNGHRGRNRHYRRVHGGRVGRRQVHRAAAVERAVLRIPLGFAEDRVEREGATACHRDAGAETGAQRHRRRHRNRVDGRVLGCRDLDGAGVGLDRVRVQHDRVDVVVDLVDAEREADGDADAW